jgi:hypothetical protein
MRKVIFLLFCALTSTSIFFACQKDTNLNPNSSQPETLSQKQTAITRAEISPEVDNCNCQIKIDKITPNHTYTISRRYPNLNPPVEATALAHDPCVSAVIPNTWYPFYHFEDEDLFLRFSGAVNYDPLDPCNYSVPQQFIYNVRTTIRCKNKKGVYKYNTFSMRLDPNNPATANSPTFQIGSNTCSIAEIQ